MGIVDPMVVENVACFDISFADHTNSHVEQSVETSDKFVDTEGCELDISDYEADIPAQTVSCSHAFQALENH